MKRSRFTEEQIIAILGKQEAGVPVMICAESTGSARRPYTSGRPSLGCLDVSEARRLRAREEENTKLKRLLVEAMLANVALKDLPGKKW